MSMKTQGTHLYLIDPADCSILQVACVRGVTGVGATLNEDDETCLEDEAPSFSPGAWVPGTANFELNFDTANPSHKRLYELFMAKETLNFAVGWSDGTDAPGVDSDCDFELPATRSWVTFVAYISGLPWDFALSARVTSSVPLRMSGVPVLIPKAA